MFESCFYYLFTRLAFFVVVVFSKAAADRNQHYSHTHTLTNTLPEKTDLVGAGHPDTPTLLHKTNAKNESTRERERLEKRQPSAKRA